MSDPARRTIPRSQLGPELAALERLEKALGAPNRAHKAIGDAGVMHPQNAYNFINGADRGLHAGTAAKLHTFLAGKDPEYAAARPTPPTRPDAPTVAEKPAAVRSAKLAKKKRHALATTHAATVEAPQSPNMVSVIMQRTVISGRALPSDAKALVDRWSEDAIRFVLREAEREG